jgi:hypothetical protein
MGEEFISKKKERFDHGRDEAVQRDFMEENLLSRLPDVSTTVYRCTLTAANCTPQVGDLVGLAELGDGKMCVLDRNVVIGHVQPGDARKLRTALQGSSVKMLVAKVHSVGALSRNFTVTLET